MIFRLKCYRSGQFLKAGDNVEQFLDDAALTQAAERPAALEQFVDISVGAFIAARWLAISLERDSAQARKSGMKRYSRMSAGKVKPLGCGGRPVVITEWLDAVRKQSFAHLGSIDSKYRFAEAQV